MTSSTTRATNHSASENQRRVAFATIVGTTVEWYDFFIYAQAAGLVFAQLFFAPAGNQIGLFLSFASVGISFLFRPLGAFLAGHLGDKLGRKAVLGLTLILMGAATTLIGLLPTYATAGVIAPIMLIMLRILQGISAGGEWGGAALMAVEHAPAHRRGLAGSFPQLGVPLGMLLASGVTALMTSVVSPGDEFLEWGWRVPFLISVVLVLVGYFVRRSVDESPIFQEIAERKEQTKAPIAVLFRRHWFLLVLTVLLFAGMNAGGYLATGGFLTNYATNPEGPIGLGRTPVLLAITATAAVWFAATLFSGIICDRIGRKTTYIVGYIFLSIMAFPLFWMINTADIIWVTGALCLFAVGLGLTYGPQAAWYAELFPADIRFSGVSIAYALGAIIGGAFSPIIAQMILNTTGNTTAISVYLLVMFLVALGAALLLRDRSGIPLGIDHQTEQQSGATVLSRN